LKLQSYIILIISQILDSLILTQSVALYWNLIYYLCAANGRCLLYSIFNGIG